MRTSPWPSRWTSLLTLTFAMCFLASEATSFIGIPCCIETCSQKINENIKACFKEGKQEGCPIDAYRLITDSGKEYCVKPSFPKLKQFLKNNPCPPITSKKRRLELLRDLD